MPDQFAKIHSNGTEDSSGTDKFHVSLPAQPGGSFPRPPAIRATGLTKKFLQPSPVNRMRKLNQGMIWVNNC